MTPLEELNTLNRLFCEGAKSIRLERPPQAQGGETIWQNTDSVPDISKEKVAVHRQIFSQDGTKILFIPDLDFYGKSNTVQRTYDAGVSLLEVFPKFFVKFSGNIGFHPMQQIDLTSRKWKDHAEERTPYLDRKRIDEINKEIEKLGHTAHDISKRKQLTEEKESIAKRGLNLYLTHVLHAVSKHVKGLTVNQEIAKRQDKVWMDFKFRDDKMIRGLCINFKSGDYSVSVDLKTDSVDDILERAALKTPIEQRKVEIPEFDLYGLADPNDEIPGLKDVLTAPIKPVAMPSGKGKVAPENFYPCVKLALSLEPAQLNQDRAFFITTYLNKSGYTREEIIETFKKIFKQKFNQDTTTKQVDYILRGVGGRPYGYAGPKTVNEQYGLCLKEKCQLWKQYPGCFKQKKPI